MCSQETPNVNNPNKEDRDSLLLRRFQKDLGRGLGSPSVLRAVVRLQRLRERARMSSCLMSLVLITALKSFSCGIKTKLEALLCLLPKDF